MNFLPEPNPDRIPFNPGRVVPVDFFDPSPDSLGFGWGRASGPSLDEKRIVPAQHSFLDGTLSPQCRSSFSRTFESISLTSGKRFDINCRSHRCEKHRDKWASRWGAIISEQITTTPVSLLVNLTTPQWVSPKEVARALEYFIKLFRAIYGQTRYLKIVEENKKHTQPHFHMLLICEQLEIPPMPNWFIKQQKKKKKKLSWPEPIFEDVKLMWTEALSYAKPNVYFKTKEKTGIVWCQPPQGKGERAAQYALGYITGQNQRAKGKGEDVSDKWRGRKITFSKNFFDRKTAEIWAGLLQKWFGNKEPEDFGLVFRPSVPRDLRLQWLEKKSTAQIKTRLDIETGEIISELLSGLDVRYKLHLGLHFEAAQLPMPEPIVYPIYGYGYLSKDKLFECDIGDLPQGDYVHSKGKQI